MMDESSVGMIFPFPSVSGKSNQIPWFQSPPTRHFSCSLIFYVISYTSLFIFYQKICLAFPPTKIHTIGETWDDSRPCQPANLPTSGSVHSAPATPGTQKAAVPGAPGGLAKGSSHESLTTKVTKVHLQHQTIFRYFRCL